KVKMSPTEALDMLIDDGAGFAGGAVWGMGQGAHSHDMMGRIDLNSYTPIPWQPNTARFASDLYVDNKTHPYCPRVNLKRVLDGARKKGYTFNVGIEPEHFLVKKNADGSISPWDPNDKTGLRLSKGAHHFIGGVLKHAKALCAVMSPTANCYKRILFGERLHSSRSGFIWTPAFITYADNNPMHMIRVCGLGHIED